MPVEFWLGLVTGLIIGWLVEWVIDWRFWRGSVKDSSREEMRLRRRLEAAEQEIQSLQEQLDEGTDTDQVQVDNDGRDPDHDRSDAGS
jgi:hypothetical protein